MGIVQDITFWSDEFDRLARGIESSGYEQSFHLTQDAAYIVDKLDNIAERLSKAGEALMCCLDEIAALDRRRPLDLGGWDLLLSAE
jgi:hypothetical protein